MALGLRKYGQLSGILFGVFLLILCLGVVARAWYKRKNEDKKEDQYGQLLKVE